MLSSLHGKAAEPNLLPLTALHFALYLDISEDMSAFCKQGIHRVNARNLTEGSKHVFKCSAGLPLVM